MGAQICTLHDIGPAKGPARKMAEFITLAIADTSDFDRPDTAPGPACFKCRKRDNHRVATAMPDDDSARVRDHEPQGHSRERDPAHSEHRAQGSPSASEMVWHDTSFFSRRATSKTSTRPITSSPSPPCFDASNAFARVICPERRSKSTSMANSARSCPATFCPCFCESSSSARIHAGCLRAFLHATAVRGLRLGPFRPTLGRESESRAIPTAEIISGKKPGIPCPFTN